MLKKSNNTKPKVTLEPKTTGALAAEPQVFKMEENTVVVNSEKLAALEKRVDSADWSARQLNMDMDEIRGKFTKLHNRDDQLSGEIRELQNAMKILNATNTALKIRCDTMSKVFNAFAEVTNDRFRELTSAGTAGTLDVSSLQTEIESVALENVAEEKTETEPSQ